VIFDITLCPADHYKGRVN